MKEVDKILNQIEDCIGTRIEKEATLEDIDIHKLNDYIYLLNREIKIESNKSSSEKANLLYRHTILLTPDNNHFNAIQRLEKSNLIFRHPQSPPLYPIFLLHRDLMREDYNTELRQIFGGYFDNLSEINQQTLSLVYQVNKYSIQAISSGSVFNYRQSNLLYQRKI